MDLCTQETIRSSPGSFSTIEQSFLSKLAINTKDIIILKDFAQSNANISVIQIDDCVQHSPKANNQKFQNKGWIDAGEANFVISKWSTSYNNIKTCQPKERFCFIFKDFCRLPYDHHPVKDNRHIIGLIEEPFRPNNILYIAMSNLSVDPGQESLFGNVKDIGWGPYKDGRQLLIICCEFSILLFTLTDDGPNQMKCDLSAALPSDLKAGITCMATRYSVDSQVVSVALGLESGQVCSMDIQIQLDYTFIFSKPNTTFPADKRPITSMSYCHDSLAIVKGGLLTIIDIKTCANKTIHAHDGTITQISWMKQPGCIASVGTDQFLRLWNFNQEIKLLYSVKNNQGALWGLALSPNESYVALLVRIEGQHKMYHLKQASSLFTVQRLYYCNIEQIMTSLLQDTPFYWDVLPLLKQLTKVEKKKVLTNTESSVAMKPSALPVLYVLYLLEKKSDDALKIKLQITTQHIIEALNKFLTVKKANLNDDEILSVSHMIKRIDKVDLNEAHDILAKLSSFNTSKKESQCPYCFQVANFGSTKCEMGHDLDWCPLTCLLITDLENKHCRNCDKLYFDLVKRSGFEWLKTIPQACIFCGEVLRDL